MGSKETDYQQSSPIANSIFHCPLCKKEKQQIYSMRLKRMTFACLTKDCSNYAQEDLNTDQND